jgi:hypothetical protein
MNRSSLRPPLFLGFVATSLFLLGCQGSMEAPDQGSYVQHSEAPYCGSAQATTYTGATTTVSGTGTFSYRALDWTSGTCQGLCNAPVSLGIPYGEVHILNSAGDTIQCGETTATGTYSLVIPQTAGAYSVQFLSRSFTNKVKISVLEDIYSAAPYSVSTAFNVSAGQSTVSGVDANATAASSGKIPGGAFNILADIYWANQFLRSSISNTSFVADKVSVFWKAGFNPYSYFNAPSVLASFYVAAEDRLYILGGNNGDVKSSDTDHFDDSVILHEYGHFLEAHYGHSDSPGGSHNGNFIIDPRLAWSEGFANYFQAAVLDTIVYASGSGPKGTSGFTNYIDTLGFKNDPTEGSGSGAGIQIKRSLTEAANTAVYDRPSTNEGIFREFSISRTLFKTLKASIPFQKVWDSFVTMRDTTSVTTPLHKFINFGIFNQILNTQISDATQNTTWSSILTEEKQKKDTSLYATPLVQQNPGTSPVCPATTMSPVVDASYNGDRSNQLMSNDFYVFQHDGVSKRIAFVTSSSGVVDLNLYLYADGYVYSEEEQEVAAGFNNPTLLRTSKTVNVSNNTEVESVDMTGLPAGYYMINVKAATLNKTSAALSSSVNYYLYIANGSTVSKCLVPNP